MKAVVWVVEGTWRGCIDAASPQLPADVQIALLHVTPSDVDEVARPPRPAFSGAPSPGTSPGPPDQVGGPAARDLLAAAARRLGREDAELVHRRGRAEREVVAAVAHGVDLLVVARDGDRSRLGPHSLGHATRFVVDHAPCSVLLVWPDEPPGLGSIPPPPPPVA